MMFGIPTPWLAIGALGIWLATAAGGYFYGSHVRGVAAELELSDLHRAAAELLIAANKEAAAKDAKNAIIARDTDERHAHEIADIEAARDDYASRFTKLLRTRCPASSGSVPTAAHDTGVAADSAAGGSAGTGLPEAAGSRLAAIGADANKLAATVRACVSWAAQVGR